MGSRERAIDIGSASAREILARLPAEARTARLNSGVGQDDVASALGISVSQYSRIERGLSPDVSVGMAVRMFAVLGMDLSIRTYPAGDPIRDAAHAALLERLARLLSSLDHVAHRGRISHRERPSCMGRHGCVPGVPRRSRGGNPDPRRSGTRSTPCAQGARRWHGSADPARARFPREPRRASTAPRVDRARFPVPGDRALELLGAGVDPGGNAMILL